MKWIKTKDKMPEADIPVLVIVAGYSQPFVGCRYWEFACHDDNFEDFLYWDDVHNDGQCWESVTHWMPLPKPPKDSND